MIHTSIHYSADGQGWYVYVWNKDEIRHYHISKKNILSRSGLISEIVKEIAIERFLDDTFNLFDVK